MRAVEINLECGAARGAAGGRHRERHRRRIGDGHQVRGLVAVSGEVGEGQVRHGRAGGCPLHGAALDPAVQVRAEPDVIVAAPHADNAQQRAGGNSAR